MTTKVELVRSWFDVPERYLDRNEFNLRADPPADGRTRALGRFAWVRGRFGFVPARAVVNGVVRELSRDLAAPGIERGARCES